ncbi:MAG: hypothetical protein EBU70_12720, partial [Actinobacteria bacterium]|nr:hypothetical protein [Actinomycetota bacterium]
MLSQAEAVLRDASVAAEDGGLSVTAGNESSITATNTAVTESSGTAVGAVLAFNTIGWAAQNVFAAALDTFLGTDAVGTEVPAEVNVRIEDVEIDVAGDLDAAAVSVPQITATIVNAVSSSGGAAVGFVLASNLLSSRATLVLRPLGAGETDAVVVGGDLSARASDTAGISARIGGSASSSGAASVGGKLVRNDVRSVVDTLIDRATVAVEGDVAIQARGSSTITALLTDEPLEDVDIEAVDEASPLGPVVPEPEPLPGEVEDPGEASFALNGLIATNTVLAQVRNTVLDSRITAGGDLSVEARNGSLIEADNAATAAASGAAVAATLAFNTIGWESQNVLFNALDALLGTSIGDEDP